LTRSDPNTITIKIAYFTRFAKPTDEALRRLWEQVDKGKHPWKPKAIEERSEVVSVPTFSLGVIRGKQVNLELYRLPSARGAFAGRMLVLKSMSAVIFVADASDVKTSKEAAAELTKTLTTLGDRGPGVVVFETVNVGGGDLDKTMDALERDLGVGDRPSFVIDVATGQAVLEPVKAVTKLVLAGMTR
jgi:hypothetical protein